MCLLLALPGLAAAQESGYSVSLYLANSQAAALALDPDGQLAIVEIGTGNMDGQIERLTDLNGDGLIDNDAERQAVASGLPSSLFEDEESGGLAAAGPAAAAWSPAGALYYVSNAFWPDFANDDYGSIASSVAPNASSNPLRALNPYASLARYEATVNPDGMEINPNPFSLVVDAAGNAYVNDAGANDTLKIAPDGTITTYALYPQVEIPAEFEFPFPSTQPVPTGIAFGPDGALYVGQLTGGPFLPEAASIYRLEDQNGDGDALDEGELTVFADGLTTVTDIAFGPDGTLYASEFRGFLTSGSEDPEAPPPADGDVVKWTGNAWETVASGLLMPTNVKVGADGAVYILTLDGMLWRALPAS
jgi:hypothetical protein